jgi:hypothetical protein
MNARLQSDTRQQLPWHQEIRIYPNTPLFINHSHTKDIDQRVTGPQTFFWMLLT